jgi:hypothetical protein
MKKTAYLSLTLAFLMLLSGVKVKAVYASPRLYFDPANANKTLNETFTVTAKVDTSGEIVGSIDGMGSYDSSKLDLVSITKASDMVFNDVEGGGGCQIGTSSGGKFSFSCYANSVLSNSVPSGNLVIFTFKAKATGTATVAYTCTNGSTVDSNIVKSSNASDVISCSDNGTGTYVIGEGSGSSSGSSNSSSPSTTTTTTTLPKTGNVGATLGLVGFGLVSVISAIFLRFL